MKFPCIHSLLALAAGLAVSGCGGDAPPAAPSGSAGWARHPAVIEATGGAEVRTGAVTLDLPGVTQDGSSVPVSVSVDRDRAGGDSVEQIVLLALGNPSAEVAEFRIDPSEVEPRLSTRIRLDRTQTVVALARTGQGAWLGEAKEVRVTVSGCISRGTPAAEALMQARVRATPPSRPGEASEVRTLITHPMETGLRRDRDGEIIPQRLLTSLHGELGDRTILEARFHRAVAANPYLLFSVTPREPGTLTLSWAEEGGATARETLTIGREGD